MEQWVILLLPIFLLLGRVSAFVSVLPIFGWELAPMVTRVGLAILLTVFFGLILPMPQLPAVQWHWTYALVLVSQEILLGLALGMVARLLFTAVQQGIVIGTQQMGFADAGVIDPTTGEDSSESIPMLYQMVFVVLFLSVGGHHILLRLIEHSYEVFPPGQSVALLDLVDVIVQAGSTMLVLALKLGAPILAGFLLVSVILGVLARVMPEMNILMASFPMRVTAGMVLSLVVLGTMKSFVAEIVDTFEQLLF